MANSQSERTFKLREGFMSLHNQGLGVSEIAENFDLHPVTVYRLLDEIAEAAGVTRESLLQRPHTAHASCPGNHSTVPMPINLIDYQNHVQETLSDFDDTIATVNQYIAAQEDIQAKEEAKC